ncbi:MmcQ/YjbR family DNA-binding protein [Halalkalibacter sp. APA_J-10(15)]|uniref:MmcQ/YjbR family DNA-binding protein n=1 Tax=unclassified Halalkalibacter TaxID=2893063 RepID=UPI001FF32656|nr:MmcQ/YjbR family DNA-binding protein [Halalkalibacter sp. APA_J-10(15)]MCK0471777.1 MmcQ/YjbR family DNA-binding protein [Halalkalibacter sp. APA_J-10(15)]
MQSFIEEVCQKQLGAERDYKEEWEAIRYLVGEKIFAMMGTNGEGKQIVTLKCEPERADHYRREFESVIPGYYVNKTHWNSVLLEECDVPKEIMEQMIEESYGLVFSKLTKKKKEELKA